MSLVCTHVRVCGRRRYLLFVDIVGVRSSFGLLVYEDVSTVHVNFSVILRLLYRREDFHIKSVPFSRYGVLSLLYLVFLTDSLQVHLKRPKNIKLTGRDF